MGMAKNTHSASAKYDKLRDFVYKHSLLIVVVLSGLSYYLLTLYNVIPYNIFKDGITTIGITLAGFIFTGQSILLAFNADNKFIKKLSSTEYIKDIHSFCKRSEFSLIAASVLNYFATSGKFIQILCVYLFVFGVIFCVWAIWIINQIAHYYSENS